MDNHPASTSDDVASIGDIVPPLPPIDSCTQVVVRGVLAGGETWVNSLHFVRDALEPYSESVTHISEMLDTCYTALKAFWPNTTTVVDYTFRDLEVPGTNATTRTPALPIIGSQAAADALPNDTAICVTIETNANARRGRGRIFLPATIKAHLTSTAGTGPQYNNALVTGVANAVGELLNEPEGSELNGLGVFSRANLECIEARGGYVDSIVDTMRRRDNRLVPQYRVPLPTGP